MEYRTLAWPPETAALRLDHERFAYAGKFVVPSGTAVAVEGDPSFPRPREGYACGVVAAARFDPDRTDPGTLVVRYVTTRRDRRGAGTGPRLLAVVTAGAGEAGDSERERSDSASGDGGTRPFERVRIAVNNPFAHEAAAKAGFAFTGRETGLAELVCERSAGGAPRRVSPDAYRAGLSCFVDRDLAPEERAFVEARRERGPPAPVAVPGDPDPTRTGTGD